MKFIFAFTVLCIVCINTLSLNNAITDEDNQIIDLDNAMYDNDDQISNLLLDPFIKYIIAFYMLIYIFDQSIH